MVQFCTENSTSVPEQWVQRGLAGKDWFTNFMHRHPSLSVRTPEATSYARAINFNKVNVGKFFDNLGSLLEKHKFQASEIYNVDETGVTTVQRPSKIVAVKGTKQVGALTSGERGTLVTVCTAVNAVGNTVPPLFIFPRKKFQNFFINNGPPGCIGEANGSGWMNEETFLVFMKHFINHVRPTKEKKVLLLLDNHDSHLFIKTIELCRENGIILLSFPPHTSHKLQPLDRGVYGPFKHYVNLAMDNWMKCHPGQTMTIYDLPGIVAEAFPKATTPTNIAAGFKVSGIWPYNRDVFRDDEYAPSSVTDKAEMPQEENETHDQNKTVEDIAIPGPSSRPDSGSPESQLNNSFKVLESIRPLPKAVVTRKKVTKRRTKRSAILTDTPEKQLIEENAFRKQKAVKRKIDSEGKDDNTENKNKQRNKRKSKGKENYWTKQHESTDEEDEESICPYCFGLYQESASSTWIQCHKCKKWAHEKCAHKLRLDFFYCLHCDDDDDHESN